MANELIERYLRVNGWCYEDVYGDGIYEWRNSERVPEQDGDLEHACLDQLVYDLEEGHYPVGRLCLRKFVQVLYDAGLWEGGDEF